LEAIERYNPALAKEKSVFTHPVPSLFNVNAKKVRLSIPVNLIEPIPVPSFPFTYAPISSLILIK
jgi:hypothetical protein